MKGWTIVVLIVLVIVAVLLILILLPLSFRLMAHSDILHNHLYFSVRALGLKVFSGSIKLHGNLMYFTTKKGKETALKIVAPATDEDSIASYISPYIPHINIKKLNLYSEIGKSDDAFFSAMALGVVKCLFLALFGKLRSRYPKMKLDYGFEGLYNLDHFQITLNCILSVSIADIIYAIYRSIDYHKLMTKKGDKKNGAKRHSRQRAPD